MNDPLAVYLRGERLWGDDFTIQEIAEWYADEQQAYADNYARDENSYRYAYHELNRYHGFAYLTGERYHRALGFGSAFGHEFLPIIDRIDEITILEPTDRFATTRSIQDVPCRYQRPNIDGILPFDKESFDLILCLGALHHVPNVTTVLRECFRCLAHGGAMLVREPIVSMGDWRKPRGRLTKRERGIPFGIFENIIVAAGFDVSHRAFCVFPPVARIAGRLGVSAYNHRALTRLDDLLSRVFSWNRRYHRTNVLEKVGPVSVYYVLTKS